MTDSIFLSLKGSYLVIPVLVVFSVIVTFIDSKISKKDLPGNTYLKVGLLSAIIGMICVYINTLKGHIQEEVLTGAAPF